MGVAAEVGEDLVRAGKRPLRVDNPRFRVQRGAQVVEILGGGDGSTQVKGFPAMAPLERRQEFPAEEGGHDFDGGRTRVSCVCAAFGCIRGPSGAGESEIAARQTSEGTRP